METRSRPLRRSRRNPGPPLPGLLRLRENRLYREAKGAVMTRLVGYLIYGVPLAILGFVICIILNRYQKDCRRISSWVAITFTSLSALGGVWGFIILDQLSKRSPFDYGYEGR